MKLYAVYRVFTVFHPHDLFLIRPGDSDQFFGEGVRLDDQGMIPNRPKRVGYFHEQVIAVMEYHRLLAVHDPGSVNDLSAERLADGLMAQAHAENRHEARSLSNQLDGNTGG